MARRSRPIASLQLEALEQRELLHTGPTTTLTASPLVSSIQSTDAGRQVTTQPQSHQIGSNSLETRNTAANSTPNNIMTPADGGSATLVSVGTLNYLEGNNSTYSLATVSSTGTAPLILDHAEVNWGDGYGITITGNSTTASHYYQESGTYTITITGYFVIIGSPSYSAISTATDTAVVADAPLAFNYVGLTGINNIQEGSSTGVVNVATFIDGNYAATVADFTGTIDWGDGSVSPATFTFLPGNNNSSIPGIAFAVSGSHTYQEEGKYYISVQAQDDDGQSASITDSALADIRDADLKLTAVSGLQTTEGQAFSGTLATLADGNPFATPSDYTVTIDWGDGTTSSGTVSGSNVQGSHTYKKDGSYSPTIEVDDDGGKTASITEAFQVNEAPLTVTGNGTIQMTEGQSFSGVLATINDSDGSAPTNDYTATVDWGDGSKSTFPVTGLTVTGTHVYKEENNYTITVTVVDGTAGGTATSVAAVGDANLTVSPANFTATEGIAFSGTIATLVDANPYATSADYTIMIDWGDQTTSSGSVVALGNGRFNVVGTHIYKEETPAGSPRTVNVTIADDGGKAGRNYSNATVIDAPLIPCPAATLNLVEDSPFSGQIACFTDLDPSAPISDFTATIDWGDGGTTTGTVVPDVNGGFGVLGSYTYLQEYEPGQIYTIAVTINDVGGSSTIAHATANVIDEEEPKVMPCATNSPAGVSYFDGSVRVTSSGFSSDGFGTSWGQGLTWTNLGGLDGQSNNGTGFVNDALPSLQQDGSNQIMAVDSGSQQEWFQASGSGGASTNAAPSGSGGGTPTYTARFFDQNHLVVDPTTGDYVLTDTAGGQTRFHGFGSTVPASEQGRFESYTDPGGNIIAVTATTSNGKISEEQRTSTVGGVTTTESYFYTYITSGLNAGLVQNAALRRQVNGGPWTTVRQTAYTYYDGTQPNGNQGDLQTAIVEDGAGNALDTTYYRYYTNGEANGYTHGLKYVVNPESYARLVVADGNPLTATDAQVAVYADEYFQYNSQHRVTEMVTQGAGCSCSGSTGQGTYNYAYSSNTNTPDYNTWSYKTVETLPDGNQNIVYTNFAGEVIVSAFDDINDSGNSALSGSFWVTYNRYDNQGRSIMTAKPSAVMIQSLATLNSAASNNLDIVGYNSSSNSYQYLSATSGVINLTDYGTSSTATNTAPGDVYGYAKDDKVQQGYAGTPILLDSSQYFVHFDASGNSVFPIATSTVYRNSDGTGAETTTNSYTWFPNYNQIQSKTVSAPVVSAAQNGPGTPDVVTTVYDPQGRPIWTMDADGFINYIAYDNTTGATVETITDVNTSLTNEFVGLPSGWSTPSSGGLNLVTLYQVDGLGRTVEETSPAGNVTYTVYDDPDHEVRVYPGWNSTNNGPTGPTEVYREDFPGSYTETLTMSATPHLTNGVPDGTEAIANIQSLSRTYTDNSGRAIEKDNYFSLPGVSYSTASHIGTLGTNYYATTYGYDERGRLSNTVDAVGTITDTIYDALGRVYQTYIGTNDSGFWSGSSGSGSNMTLVEQDIYDNNSVGDSNLTQVTQYPDASASDNRVTQYAYDWRDRLVATKSGVQSSEDTTTHRPIIYDDLDNLGEVTAVSQFDGDGVALSSSKPSASLLRAYAVTSYDDQGRPYKVSQYGVNQSTGALSTYTLTTNDFYDHRGNLIAESAPGGQVTRMHYDGAGRFNGESISDPPGGVTWAGASTLFAVHAVTQTGITYDADGNVILVVTRDRFDNDTDSDTGGLATPTSSNNKARVSYEAYYYDAADRQIADVNVGTNGGTTYTRPSSVPARSDTVLITSDTYNAAGWVQDEVDPRGVDTHTTYDLLGRPTQVINAYNASINGGLPTSSANQTTNYAYNGIDKVTDVTAVMPSGTPSQTTHYEYHATTATSSNINSNDFLTQIWQPDPTTGAASTAHNQETWYTYNALGDLTILTDPNQTAHTYTYDVLGRQTSDAVTTLASGVDGSILRHTTAYDTGGRPYLYTSYNATSGGSIVNQVQDVYNGLGQLTGEYQEQNGAVNTATSPEVRYAYTEMSSGQDNSRLTQMTYPSGRAIDYVYSATLDAAISRVTSIADDNSGTPGTILESYSYLGLGTIVQKAHPEPGVNLSYIQQSGDTHANTDAGDRYTGLDRFGRVIDQNWINTNTGTSVNRYQYGYDRNGNVLNRADLVDTALSELYHPNSTASGDNSTAYDPLGRLTSFSRGTLTSSGNNGSALDTVSTATRNQSWQLDALGNWVSVTDSGTTTNRTFNSQNQATSVTSGTAPTFDQNGNTLTNFNPLISAGQQNVYDAWNQLVGVKNTSGTTLASYIYDALGRRMVESYPTQSTTNHLYYDSQGQVIEERLNGTAASNLSNQYVWGLDYVNSLVLRDAYSGGTRTQRLYAIQDANYNTTALVDTTGAVQERYLYDPYGNVTILDPNWVPRTGNTSADSWRYLFQGGRRDVATGWYEFGRRDLITSEGRWAERDPLGQNAGDINLYRYVSNNPIDEVDPTGLGGRRVTAEGIVAASGGHHPVPFAVWAKRGLPVEVQKIFNEVMEHSPTHTYTKAHAAYNRRVKQILEHWLGGIDPSKVTPEQARAFSDTIRSSDDAFIKGFLSRLKQSKEEVNNWFNKIGKKYLDDEAKLLAAFNEVGCLSQKSARVVGAIANKAGKVFKVIAIGTAIYYVSEGGVLYAAERTVKDAVFFDELAPHVQKVGAIVDGRLQNAVIDNLKSRFSSFPPQERDLLIRGALTGNPDLYRLYTGEESPGIRPTYP